MTSLWSVWQPITALNDLGGPSVYWLNIIVGLTKGNPAALNELDFCFPPCSIAFSSFLIFIFFFISFKKNSYYTKDIMPYPQFSFLYPISSKIWLLLFSLESTEHSTKNIIAKTFTFLSLYFIVVCCSCAKTKIIPKELALPVALFSAGHGTN